MRKEDVHRLFDLLERLYQGKNKPRDDATIAIWHQVLKPWPYEQVRNAVVQRARENRYMPDPSELAVCLPEKRMGEADLRAKEDMARMRAFMEREKLREV